MVRITAGRLGSAERREHAPGGPPAPVERHRTVGFAMVLFAAFTTQVGALDTAPVLIAVVTSYLDREAVKYVVTSRKRAATATAPPAAS